jgi:hypothetical protein
MRKEDFYRFARSAYLLCAFRRLGTTEEKCNAKNGQKNNSCDQQFPPSFAPVQVKGVTNRRNSVAAAAAIRALSDEQLDQAAPVSLNSDAPLTCQFFLEDHAVRHSYHHLARIRRALKK